MEPDREDAGKAPERNDDECEGKTRNDPIDDEDDQGKEHAREGDANSSQDAVAATTSLAEDMARRRTAEDCSPKDTNTDKIKVHFVAVGSAPILKKCKFFMSRRDRFAVAVAFLRRLLRPSSGAASSSLFLYVNAAFVPSPDECIGDLFDRFNIRGELVLHYILQEDWG